MAPARSISFFVCFGRGSAFAAAPATHSLMPAPFPNNQPLSTQALLRVRAEVGGVSGQNVSDAIGRGINAAQSAAAKAQDALSKAASGDLQPIKVPMPNVNVDLAQLVQYNFLAQLVLTGVSWATVFATSHAALMGKGAVKAVAGSPATAVLLFGVLIAAYSAYQSFTYVAKVKKEGLNVLSAGTMSASIFEHAAANFIGCGCALVALFAEVGSLVMGSVASSSGASRLAIEALAQASATTILAHVVSLAFLFALLRKINEQTLKLVEWADNLRKAMPGMA